MPKISVIMPAYNAEKYIAEAIDSILGQTFGDFEFIILNDCSKDRTEEIILSYSDSRIVYLKNEKNMGVAATLNRGLSVARGEYIARMDADDISLPERFEKQVAYMEANPETMVLGCALERFGQDIKTQVRSFSTDSKQMRIDLLFACGLAHPSVMMRRAVIMELGGYDMSFEGMEDYELWCRVLNKHEITTLPDVLLRYRVHSAQVTKNPSAQYLTRMRALKALQLKQLGLPTTGEEAQSFFLFCTGRRPGDLQHAAVLCHFMESVMTANETVGFYDSGLLLQNFRNITLQLAQALPDGQGWTLCKETNLLRPGQLVGAKLKKTLKWLLGR